MNTYKIQTTDENSIQSKVKRFENTGEAIDYARTFSIKNKRDVKLFEEKESGFEEIYSYSSYNDEEHYS
jgi:hypothetical protein